MKYSTYYKKDKSEENIDKNYCKWIDQVEYIVYRKYKTELLDLPDQMYMHHFENNITPEEMAEILFEELLIDLTDE